MSISALIARNTEPVYVRRGLKNLLSVSAVLSDRTSDASLINGQQDIAVYLRGELVWAETDLSPVGVNGPVVESTMLEAATEGKGFGPILIHWKLLGANQGGPDFKSDILQDGWLVRYFPTPSLTDADLLDLNPDLLAMAGPSVLTSGTVATQIPGFERFHKRAWSMITRKLFRMGRRVELNLSPSQLWDIEYHETTALIAGYYWQTMGDQKWLTERKEQLDMARDAWGAALLQYDLDEDGKPDERWTYPTTPLIRTGRASRHGGRPLVAGRTTGTIP